MIHKSYFRSSGYLPNSQIRSSTGRVFSVEALPSFLRALLVTDGTVTKILEAWFWEPVGVKLIQQSTVSLSKPIEGLEVEVGEKVLQREVCLIGKSSGQRYACAYSVLALSQLPASLRDAMLAGGLGIGELLSVEGVETYREIIALDYFPQSAPDERLLTSFDDDLVSRSYRIRVGGSPTILVREYFPINTYSRCQNNLGTTQ